MSERNDKRHWYIIAMPAAVLLVLGGAAVVWNLAQNLGLGLVALGGLAILLFGIPAVAPPLRKYFFSEAEQRVVVRNAPAFCLMLAVVWIVPGLLGYFGVVPEEAAFMLAFAAFWLVGAPVLGWHHGQVTEVRRRDQDRAGLTAETTPTGPVGSVASEPMPAAPPKRLAVSLLAWWWSLIPGAIVGALIVLSALQTSGTLEHRQLLEITNVGSRPVNVGEATLAPGVKYLAYLPDGTPIVVEEEQVATFNHQPRTAEVEKTVSGVIQFHFSDE